MSSFVGPIDVTRFERRLNEAVSMVSLEEALGRTLCPLHLRVGELWHDQKPGIAVEHFVTKQVQQRLSAAIQQLRVAEFGPPVVIACPHGERHQIAAMMVTSLARLRGCRVLYLGVDAPIAALGDFCRRVRTALIALSLVNQMGEAHADGGGACGSVRGEAGRGDFSYRAHDYWGCCSHAVSIGIRTEE